MKKVTKEGLIEDFSKMISSMDAKSYASASPEIMSALFIGMLWQLISELPMDVDHEDEEYFGKDIDEELNGAEKYLDCYNATSDMQYKQMAADELRHAKMLINMVAPGVSPENEDALNNYEHRRSMIAEKLM